MANTTMSSYYVPDQSKYPVFASLGLFLTLMGLGHLLTNLKAGEPAGLPFYVMILGFLVFGAVLFFWFSTVRSENLDGKVSGQLKGSYVWAMKWFIFSEVMFFAAFFGGLYYIRVHVVPWLGGEGDKGVSNMLWPGFEAAWPLITNPDPSAFSEAKGVVHWSGLPLINTFLLLTSSVTAHFSHVGILKNNRKAFIGWLALTIILGISFIVCQYVEYHEAYSELDLTLASGIYGSTFYLLTGFHGFHVILGTLILSIIFLRASLKGDFTAGDHFGFAAASWYWHFVDVVWIMLFTFVYVL